MVPASQDKHIFLQNTQTSSAPEVGAGVWVATTSNQGRHGTTMPLCGCKTLLLKIANGDVNTPVLNHVMLRPFSTLSPSLSQLKQTRHCVNSMYRNGGGVRSQDLSYLFAVPLSISWNRCQIKLLYKSFKCNTFYVQNTVDYPMKESMANNN